LAVEAKIDWHGDRLARNGETKRERERCNHLESEIKAVCLVDRDCCESIFFLMRIFSKIGTLCSIKMLKITSEEGDYRESRLMKINRERKRERDRERVDTLEIFKSIIYDSRDWKRSEFKRDKTERQP